MYTHQTMNVTHPDTERGFDVMRGAKVIAHFDTLDEARADARRRGAAYYVRYWGTISEA